MTQRSPHNERSKNGPKGSTRRSASAAKPKRDVAAAAPVKKKATPKWGRGPATLPDVPRSDQEKRLQLVWYGLMAVAVGASLVLLFFARKGAALESWSGLITGVYAAAIGGAIYMTFGPMRAARRATVEGAMASKKSKKRAAAEASAAGDGGAADTAGTDRTEDDTDGGTP